MKKLVGLFGFGGVLQHFGEIEVALGHRRGGRQRRKARDLGFHRYATATVRGCRELSIPLWLTMLAMGRVGIEITVRARYSSTG